MTSRVSDSVGSARDRPEPEQPPERDAGPRRSALPLGIRAALPGILTLVFAIWALRPIKDPDTFWHLATGDRLRSSWSFSGPDPWSSMSTQPWRLHEWLPELVMSWVQQLGGLPAVAVLLPVATVAILLLLWRALRTRAGLLVTAIVMTVALLAMTGSLSLRPHLVSFALTVVTVDAWLRSAEDHRPRWWLIALGWVWACSHGMWFVGIAIGVVTLTGLAFDRSVTRREWGSLALVPLAALFAAALTPVGPELLLSPFAVHETTQFIQEWRPPSLGDAGFLSFLGLAAGTVIIWARRRVAVPWVHVLLLGLAIAFALLYIRTVPVGAAIVAPLTAAALHEASGMAREPLGRREVVLTAGLAALGLLVAGVLAPSRAAEPAWGPNDLDAQIAALPAGTVICNDYGIGGWLIWKHPNVRPAIDGRVEVYSLEHVRLYMDFHRANPGWTAYLTETKCTYALVANELPPAEALVAQTNWSVVVRGKTHVLLKAPA